jgi:hypothetical protein
MDNIFCGTHPTHQIGARYIIMTTEYLTRWAKAALLKDCIEEMVARFIFENVITRFGCPRVLMRNQGSHFHNETIHKITQAFMIHH